MCQIRYHVMHILIFQLLFFFVLLQCYMYTKEKYAHMLYVNVIHVCVCVYVHVCFVQIIVLSVQLLHPTLRQLKPVLINVFSKHMCVFYCLSYKAKKKHIAFIKACCIPWTVSLLSFVMCVCVNDHSLDPFRPTYKQTHIHIYIYSILTWNLISLLLCIHTACLPPVLINHNESSFFFFFTLGQVSCLTSFAGDQLIRSANSFLGW